MSIYFNFNLSGLPHGTLRHDAPVHDMRVLDAHAEQDQHPGVEAHPQAVRPLQEQVTLPQAECRILRRTQWNSFKTKVKLFWKQKKLFEKSGFYPKPNKLKQ